MNLVCRGRKLRARFGVQFFFVSLVGVCLAGAQERDGVSIASHPGDGRVASLVRAGETVREVGSVGIGGGQTEQGATFRATANLNVPWSRISLEFHGGAPVLRLRGQLEVVPVTVFMRTSDLRQTPTSAVRRMLAALDQFSYFSVSLIPATVAGQWTLNRWTSSSPGNSWVFVAPEVMMSLVRYSGASFLSGLVGSTTYLSARLALGYGVGYSHDDDGGSVVTGPQARIEGNMFVGIGMLHLSAQAWARYALNLLDLGRDQRAMGLAVGPAFGLPTLNSFWRPLGQGRTAWVALRAEGWVSQESNGRPAAGPDSSAGISQFIGVNVVGGF